MKTVRLDGRLSCCADFAREGSRLADIGTDHGYLPIYLVSAGVALKALACDINPLPLKSAKENIARYRLDDLIRTRLSDGLKEVKEEEADDIVIAGMGGELIASILSGCEWIKNEKKHLILQPMTRVEKLVFWLYQNGFEILRQKACHADKKYYTVMLVRYSGVHMTPDLFSCYFGKLDVKDETAKAFLLQTLKRLKKQAIADPRLLDVITKIEEVIL